jgi:glyoxylase-like metal-dependent hydrolase (beta-lactamase superfamily II)
LIPVIKYQGRTLVFTGDLIPTAAHIPLIWNMSYDLDSLRTIEEKKKLLDDSVRDGYVLIFQHDVSVECCTAESSSKGTKLKEKLLFSEISFD